MKIKRILQTIISMAVVIAALMAVSCGENPMPTGTQYPSGTNSTAPTNSSENTNSTKNTEPTPTTSSQKIDEPIVWKNGYTPLNVSTYPIDLGSKILIRDGIGKSVFAIYYSKIDGELYPFCFDPLCAHDNAYCPSGFLIHSRMKEIALVNDRVYFKSDVNTEFKRGAFIYSCSLMANDLRLELSLYENIELFRDPVDPLFMDLYPGRDSLFFHITDKNGWVWYRYDTKKRKLYAFADEFGIEIPEKDYIVINKVTEEKIYYSIADNYYVTDYDSKISVPCDIGRPRMNAILFEIDNEDYYYDVSTVCFYKITLSGEKVVIAENFAENPNVSFVYLRDDYLYYTYSVNKYGTKVVDNEPIPGYNIPYYPDMLCKIFRYNIKTRETQCVFDNVKYDYFDLYYLDDEQFFGRAQVVNRYDEVRKRYETTQRYIMGDIDDDGNFVNVTERKELDF